MNEFTISELKRLQKGEHIIFTKDTDSELSKIISQLKNLDVLKQEKFRISVKNSKHLSKIIELKSIDEYLEWLNNKGSIIKLNKEQSEKADHILELVCNSDDGINAQIAFDLFETENETLKVLSILEKYNLIKLYKNQNDDITLIGWTIETCHFFRDGGFLKKYKQTIKQNIQPTENENKQKATTSFKEKFWTFIVKFWWGFVIPILVIIIGILIEKGIIDIGI